MVAEVCKGGCGRPPAPRDVWCYACALAGLAPTSPLAPPRTYRIVRYQAIVCLWCGRHISRGPASKPLWLELSVSDQAVLPADLRCHVCGGPAIPGEDISSQRIYSDPFDWDSERPRRGRPPRSLVAQRKAARPERGETP